jgi:CRISPR-associated protein Cas2
MLVIAYDISDDKLRLKFSKYLSKFGGRLQYSVFEIKNSPRILNQIQIKIASYFKKKFTQNDSIIIFELSKNCKITTYGYAKNNNSDLLII